MGRRSRTKLHHGTPPADAAEHGAFAFRTADLDPAGHVNNAVYWAVLEDELADLAVTDAVDAEIEHRSAMLAGRARVVAAGESRRWVLDGEGAVVASFVVAR